MSDKAPPVRPEEVHALRGAAARRDRRSVVAVLRGRDPSIVLQHAGDALLAVGPAGLEDVVRDVEERLRRRGDDGDAQLADELARELRGQGPVLRPVPLDTDQLAELVEGGSGGWVDLDTGETWPDSLLDVLGEDERPPVDDGPGSWWRVEGLGPGPAWRDRRDFAEQRAPEQLRRRLLEALQGRGAFRRFSRVLDEDEAVLTGWLAFRDERSRGRARAVMSANGLAPAPRS